MSADPSVVLLAAAEDALGGELALPTGRATRAASLLIRTALEVIVEDYLSTTGARLGEASARVQLIVLRVLAGEDIGGEAAWAWAALSQACHHHAYQLTPTIAEVTHLLGVVTALRRQLAAALSRAVPQPPS